MRWSSVSGDDWRLKVWGRVGGGLVLCPIGIWSFVICKVNFIVFLMARLGFNNIEYD